MINRRQWLKGVALSAAAMNMPLQSAAAAVASNGALPWQNWSGNQKCQPEQKLSVRTTEQLSEWLAQNNKPFRCVGSGHSFSGLVPTDHTIVSIGRLSGLISVDAEKQTARFKAGTRLASMGKPLWDNGLGLLNMPDVNRQTLAGALSTSTHGTGMTLGSLSSQVTALKFMTLDGEEIECSAESNKDLFDAVRVSMGTLGVITEAELQVRDNYYLHEKSWMAPLDETLENMDALKAENRHIELFPLPHCDSVLIQTINEVDAATAEKVQAEADLEGGGGDAYQTFKQMSDLLDTMPFLRTPIMSLVPNFVSEENAAGRSFELLSKVRDIRFNEMEYSMPAENGTACLAEIMAEIKKQDVDVIFPLEYRYIKADDCWMSPFYQQDACAISLHNFHDKPFKPYFSIMEPILRKHGGRPHWGKINTLKADDFSALYPKWNEFSAVRRELDPKGLLLNDYLKTVFS